MAGMLRSGIATWQATPQIVLRHLREADRALREADMQPLRVARRAEAYRIGLSTLASADIAVTVVKRRRSSTNTGPLFATSHGS